MVNYADIRVRGTIDNVQEVLHQIFEQSKYRISSSGEFKGRAEKGWKLTTNTGFTFWSGGRIQVYYAVDFEISGSSDNWNVRLIRAFEGMNLLNRRDVNKEFERLADFMAKQFSIQGLLIEVRKQ